MNERIKDYFKNKLLENPGRIINDKGQIVEVYNQPERSKREDHHLTLDDFSDNPTSEQLAEEMRNVERKLLDAVL